MITDSWVMAAMMRSAPRRHKGQVAISRSNTRPRSLAQLQQGGPVLASCPSIPCWRGVGVIAPRRLLCGPPGRRQPPAAAPNARRIVRVGALAPDLGTQPALARPLVRAVIRVRPRRGV